MNTHKRDTSSLSDIVYPATALLVLCGLYAAYLAMTLDEQELMESFAGFYVFLPMILGIFGVVGSMLAGGWKPIPDSRARLRRVFASIIALGSVLLVVTILG